MTQKPVQGIKQRFNSGTEGKSLPVPKRDGASIFVASMLQSAQENKEVKPQTRYDNVDQEQIDKVMANIKKGLARK